MKEDEYWGMYYFYLGMLNIIVVYTTNLYIKEGKPDILKLPINLKMWKPASPDSSVIELVTGTKKCVTSLRPLLFPKGLFKTYK